METNKYLYLTLLLLINVSSALIAQTNSVQSEVQTLLEVRDQQIKKLLGPEGSDYSDQQRSQLKDIVNGIIDFDSMAKTALEITYDTISVAIRDEFVQLFIAMHDEQVIQHTQPYPDVIQVLKQLHTQNIPLAVATNKRSAPSKKLIDHFDWNDYFQSVECSDSQTQIRNKDAMIQDIINQNKLFHGSYFIGDSVNDGLSANLNQLPFIKACYGYGRNQDWSKIHIFKEIKNFNDIKKI